MFPNYALNYPAPVHGGTISPSRQYPPQPPIAPPNADYWRSLYVAPPEVDYENTKARASLVSEVLDAEVTALTNSSSPGSSPSNTAQKRPSRKSKSSLNNSSSSGVASNSKYNNTSSSSGGSKQQQFQSPDSKGPLEPIFETSKQPFYENWPPNAVLNYNQPLSIVPPVHGLMSARGSAHDTSLDTPNSGQRPGSSHSAPMLDISIDRHYEFDAKTPTDELNLAAIGDALPRQWNRPYLGYNPRQREREMGAAARLARSERVFSDSEIYSPVFPRGRPEAQTEDDVSARVLRMKEEFREYREQQQQQQQQQKQDVHSGQSSPKSVSKKSSRTGSSASKETAGENRLESLI